MQFWFGLFNSPKNKVRKGTPWSPKSQLLPLNLITQNLMKKRVNLILARKARIKAACLLAQNHVT